MVESRLLALAGVAALIVSACSSSHHGSVGAGATNPVVGSGPGVGATTTLAPGSSPSTATSRGNTATTIRSAGTTSPASHASGGPPVNTGSSPASRGNAALVPAAPGTYTMAQSGYIHTNPDVYSATEQPQGTLVVDQSQPNGIQVDHRYVPYANVQNNQPPANTTTQFLPSGPVILSTTEGAGPQAISCTFNPPIAAPPWPPAVGKSFAATGNCGSGTTISVRGTITGFQTATLKDGETFPVWVVDSTLSITGPSLNASGTQVDWYSTALRLPVHEQTNVQGSYSGIQFTLLSISDLVSSRPA